MPPLLQPEPRVLYQQLLGQGWTDAIEKKHPDNPIYTFWDYLRQVTAFRKLPRPSISRGLRPLPGR